MTVTGSIAAIKLNCQAGFFVLAFQADIAQNRALAFRREFFASNLRMQIAFICMTALESRPINRKVLPVETHVRMDTAPVAARGNLFSEFD